MTRKASIAARAGRWSAAHRKTAIFGWLAFVVVAFMIGGALGTKNIDQYPAAAVSPGAPIGPWARNSISPPPSGCSYRPSKAARGPPSFEPACAT